MIATATLYSSEMLGDTQANNEDGCCDDNMSQSVDVGGTINER